MYFIATQPENRYCNYFNYSVNICGEDNKSDITVMYTDIGKIAEGITIKFISNRNEYTFKDFKSVKREYGKHLNASNYMLKIILSEGPEDIPEAEVVMTLSRDGVEFTADADKHCYTAVYEGCLIFGKNGSASAVCLDRKGCDIRSSYGPAASKIDNSLFCRETDRALRLFSAKKIRIKYDFSKKLYCFYAEDTLKIRVDKNILADRFSIKYKGINKKNTFPTPPAGWMTWYSVQFDACEQAVLENTQKQKELFADYGANTIWVDWEWYHCAFENNNPDRDIHFFSPDYKRYPNGLKYVSDKIKEQGFTPALWVGPTNEPVLTETIKANEGLVYADRLVWCGKYFYDITKETYLKDFLPKAFEQVKKWGYEAIKWDCLPITLEYADMFHSFLTDSSLTSEEALRGAIQVARDVLGVDYYMMSCSGECDRAVLFAADLFDGGRIGTDIFSWKDFIGNFLERIMRFYSLHNNIFYCDPDNLIVRPEHNNYNQAVTRTSFFSLLGLPITLGDDLRVLPEDRVQLIRRALPPLDTRPMDIREAALEDTKVITNLQICKHFEEWNVVQVTNLLEEEKELTVNFDTELHLDEGEYLVYDYWNHQFLGKKRCGITVKLPAFGSVVLSIRRFTGKKQIVSTSRHISQGGFDLLDVLLDENNNLYGRSNVIANEPYIITCYNPITDEIIEKSFVSDKTGVMDWVI